MIDRELVVRKASLITDDLESLREIAARGCAAFDGDRVAQVLAERYLERAHRTEAEG